MMTKAQLAEIAKRVERAPGKAFAQGRGVCVSGGYAERLLNRLSQTPLYVRRKAGRYPSDQEIADSVAPVFVDAYQAHRDVEALLAEVLRLRAAQGEASDE